MGKKEATLQFKFRVRFYPENVVDEIIQGSTLRLLYLQVKADILNETIYCVAEKAVLLSSFAAQAKYGNFESNVHEAGYLANDKILPEQVMTGHKLTREEWENKISLFHAKHKGMTREDAMMEYLKVAQDLETFGISYFDITNKKGTELILGVDCLGINVYNEGDRLSPKISFPWSEINRISFKNNNFIVKLNDKKSPKFIGICRKPKMSKKIYELASGNHEMYMRRRRPDTLEVQQMKAQKRDDEAARAKEKAELSKQIAARAKAEQMREEMEAKYKEMEANMKKRESELEEAKNLEAEEKQRMEEEIKLKQDEIEEVRNLVEEKEKLTKDLQEEVEISKQQLEQTTASFATAMATQNGDASSVSSDEHDDGSLSSGEKENTTDIPEIIVDPVEEREVGMDAEMTADLEELGKELDEKKNEENETDETKVYRENLKSGADKYKTLREVRKGNTKRRIDNFENM